MANVVRAWAGVPPESGAAEADVVVVGAGLAGLSCAVHLQRRGLHVCLLEAADDIGGRVRADLFDGYRCERGFQLLNPAYPQARRVLDLDALRLQAFPRGVTVATSRGRSTLLDPRREGLGSVAMSLRGLSGLAGGAGGPRELLALARWVQEAARYDGAELLARPDEPWGAALRRRGVRGGLVDGVLQPFLAGVVGEDEGATSHRFVQLLLRSFLKGTPAVPADGMGAVPLDLARRLRPASVWLSSPVRALTREGSTWTARTDGASLRAPAAVVATEGSAAQRLIGTPDPGARGLTTFWFACAPDPARSPALHVDSLRRGPLVNAVDVSATVTSAAPAGRSLIAATALGTDVDEAAARRHLGLLVGAQAARGDLVTVSVVPAALTRMDAPLQARRPVALGRGLFVCGDHRDTASIQGALVSGRRAADAVLEHLGRAPRDGGQA